MSGCRDHHDGSVVEVEKASLLEGDVSDDCVTTHTCHMGFMCLFMLHCIINVNLEYGMNLDLSLDWLIIDG